MSYSQTKHGNGHKRGHQEKKRKAFSASATKTPLKKERSPRTIQQSAHTDIDDQNGERDSRGSLTSLAPRGSRAPRALIFRLIARLLGIQDARQKPAGPVLEENRITPSEVKPKSERSQGQLNRGKTSKKAQSKA